VPQNITETETMLLLRRYLTCEFRIWRKILKVMLIT